MHNYAKNMQEIGTGKYARALIRSVLWKYVWNMQDICMYMQNMQSRILHVVYADICIPHFADHDDWGPGRRRRGGFKLPVEAWEVKI